MLEQACTQSSTSKHLSIHLGMLHEGCVTEGHVLKQLTACHATKPALSFARRADVIVGLSSV